MIFAAESMGCRWISPIAQASDVPNTVVDARTPQGRANRRIRLKMAADKLSGSETPPLWKQVERECLTTFAPISITLVCRVSGAPIVTAAIVTGALAVL